MIMNKHLSIQEHHVAIQSAVSNLAAAMEMARKDSYIPHLDWIISSYSYEVHADMAAVKVRLEYAP